MASMNRLVRVLKRHAQLARYRRAARPARVRVTSVPDEWQIGTETALESLAAEEELTSWPKTTGGKGVYVWRRSAKLPLHHLA